MRLACKLCKKVIMNRRGCLYYKKDYEAPLTPSKKKIVSLCSAGCSLRFQGIPRKKSG